MPITVTAGTLNWANSSAPTVTLPTHATGDLLILIVGSRHRTATYATPSGWTQQFYHEATAGSNVGVPCSYVFYKVATSSSETAPTLTMTGGTGTANSPQGAVVLMVQGADVSGGLGGALASTGTTTQNIPFTNDLTTAASANDLAVAVGFKADDNTGAAVIGGTTAGATWIEIIDSATTLGNDASMVIDYTIPAAAYSPGTGGSIVLTGGTAVHTLGYYFRVTAAAASGISGTGSGSIALTGSAAGTVKVQGTATGSMALTGSGAGTVAVKGAGSGTIALTGTSAATVRVQGSGAGTIALAGSGVGTTATPGITGTGAGTIPLAGASAGAVKVQAVGSGSIAFAGTGAGKVAVKGSGAGTIAFTGSGAVKVKITANAAGSFNVTGAAAGAVKVQGTAAGDLGLAGASDGAVAIKGSAGGTIALTGAATGSGFEITLGAGAGVLHLAGSAAATVRIYAAAAGGMGFDGSGLGTVTGSATQPAVWVPVDQAGGAWQPAAQTAGNWTSITQGSGDWTPAAQPARVWTDREAAGGEWS